MKLLNNGPFAPQTLEIIQTTLKLFSEFGPDSPDYKQHIQEIDPEAGRVIHALYWMGCKIVPGESDSDGTFQDYLARACSCPPHLYKEYLRSLQLVERVNMALGFIKRNPSVMKTI